MRQIWTGFAYFILVLCVFLGSSLAVFADTILVIRSSGNPYLFDTETGAIVQEIQCDSVFLPKTYSPQPPNGDGGTPQPPSTGELQKKVQSWAAEIDDPIGNAIFGTGVYVTLAKEMSRGSIQISPDAVDKAMTGSLEEAYRMYPGDNLKEWKDFNRKVFDELSSLGRSKEWKLTQQDYSRFLSDVAAGLEAQNANRAIPAWLEPIIAELIKVLIRLIQNLFSQNDQALDSLVSVLSELSASEGAK